MIVGVHHLALGVPNLEDGVRFYCDHLGFELVQEFSWDSDNTQTQSAVGLPGSVAAGAMLKSTNAFVEMWQYETPAPRDRRSDPNDLGYAHFCLQVEDIAFEHARLSKAGMVFVGEPVDFGPAAAIYGRDPFGNVIELYELKTAEGAQLVDGRASAGA